MRDLTAEGRAKIDAIAARCGFSAGAVRAMLDALERGHGRMAQFDHPEFGGTGQWMRGGMTMVGNMFDAALKARVQTLCAELSAEIGESDFGPRGDAAPSFFASNTGAWWPADLGTPDSSGAQAGFRYAYFAAQRRLAIESSGRTTVYDTLDHRIGGAAQQQAAHGTLTLTSQHGIVDVAGLPVISGTSSSRPNAGDLEGDASDVIATIERLGELERRGLLSAAEFAAKKTELLRRL